MTAVADRIVDTLEAANVKRIYGLVGDSLKVITESLRVRDNIAWHAVRHEEVAAFAACAEAQLTGELAVCAGTPEDLRRLPARHGHHPGGGDQCRSAGVHQTVEAGSRIPDMDDSSAAVILARAQFAFTVCLWSRSMGDSLSTSRTRWDLSSWRRRAHT